MKCRIYEIAPSVSRLGPGNRVAVWFQGCPFSCAGCITPDSQDVTGGAEVDVEEITSLFHTENCLEGVTISGGEPFAQPDALGYILSKATEHGLGTIVFSGYQLEALVRKGEANRAIALALSVTDLLIDGVYQQEKRSRFGLRGSDNQSFRFLTDRYLKRTEEILGYDRTKAEMVQGLSGTMLVGVPDTKLEPVWLQMTASREEVQ